LIIITALKEKIKNMLVVHSNYQNSLRSDKYWKFIPKGSIRAVHINITAHCNLCCVGCSAFSPLAEPEFMSLNQFEKDISRLAELSRNGGSVALLTLMGGEPLLHPEIEKFMEVLALCFPNSIKVIVTNGILLSKMKETFWKTARNNSISIGVSRYPIKLDHKKIKKMTENKGCIYYDWGKRDMMWIRPLDLTGTRDNVVSFMRCSASSGDCCSLQNGKLSICGKPFVIEHFNKYFKQNIAVTEEDSIDIHSVSSFKDLLNFLAKPPPFCRFCDTKHLMNGVKWRVSGKNITEWVPDNSSKLSGSEG
jgi:hypothetical protein